MGLTDAIKIGFARMLQFGCNPSVARGFTILFSAAAANAASAEPFEVAINACSTESFEAAKRLVAEAGWRDISSPEAYQAALLEVRFQHVRAKLSRASYSKEWTDETVGRMFPSSYGDSLPALAQFQNDAIAGDKYPSDFVQQAVYSEIGGKGTLTLYAGAQTLQCWFSGFEADNPTLVDSILTTDVMRQAGYGPVTKRYNEHDVRVAILSRHGLQADDNFPVEYDLTFALMQQISDLGSNE